MSLGLSASLKALLNQFQASQPALHDTTSPAGTSGVQLGDLIDAALSTPTVVKASYAAASAGAIGAHLLSVTLPAGAKVSRLWTDTAGLASAGAATVAIAAGATVLMAATAYNDAGLTGYDAQSLTPVKLAVASQLKVTVAAFALTAGTIDVYVEYVV